MFSWMRIFIEKDGKISKTAIILSTATFIALILWPFQCLFSGSEFFGWWTVPEFNSTATIGMLMAIFTLYVTNHKLKGSKEVISPEQVDELREKIDTLTTSLTGENNDSRP